MSGTKIVIDCDPGHDDVVAILYAARHLDLLGLTTVHGNNTVDNVTRNTLAMLTLARLDIPVAKGCADPLIGRKGESINAHGKTGLDGTDLPEPDRAALDVHAVDFLIETAREHKGELVLAVVGPATNVAVAMKREPRFAGWLREITVMGGSTTVGNMSAVGEANVFNDPEAAAVVFESGAPLRMVGLNVTRVTGTRAPDIEKLRGGGRVPSAIADLLAFYRERQQHFFALDLAPMHDVCAVVPYVDESLLTYRECHVAVELQGRFTRGMTVCDLRGLRPEIRELRGGDAPNARVAVASDAQRLIDHVVDTILTYH
jgi:inosine-uridine nucleoside N-ribohydrolase